MSVGDSRELFQDIQNGDSQAQQRLLDRYIRKLIWMAAKRLPAFMNARVDPEELALATCYRIFEGAQAGRFTIERSGQLWALLAAVLNLRVLEEIRFHTAGKRDPRREVDIVIPSADGSSVIGIRRELIERDPLPQDILVLCEILDQATERLSNKQREIVRLHLQGHSHDDISKLLDCSRIIVRNAISGCRDTLLSYLK
jgi:DNA-directed RNA polymerase specialized sigma24 family protein